MNKQNKRNEENNFLADRISRIKKENCHFCKSETRLLIKGTGYVEFCPQCRHNITKFLPDILEKGRCGQCGKKINITTKELRAEQVQDILKGKNSFTCDECIASNHTITDNELKIIERN